MGIELNEVQKHAEELKEKLWYYLECTHGYTPETIAYIKEQINLTLDLIDGLEK